MVGRIGFPQSHIRHTLRSMVIKPRCAMIFIALPSTSNPQLLCSQTSVTRSSKLSTTDTRSASPAIDLRVLVLAFAVVTRWYARMGLVISKRENGMLRASYLSGRALIKLIVMLIWTSSSSLPFWAASCWHSQFHMTYAVSGPGTW